MKSKKLNLEMPNTVLTSLYKILPLGIATFVDVSWLQPVSCLVKHLFVTIIMPTFWKCGKVVLVNTTYVVDGRLPPFTSELTRRGVRHDKVQVVY